jgi:outer membrane receptor protein involved in Fe transport
VRERRGELTLNLGRNLSPTLRIDGGVAYEFSRLTVTGDAQARRSLAFWKPQLSIDWRPKGGWHARAALRRTVAQLNFYDFISVAQLSDNRVQGGNAQLLPQQSWEARATLEKTLLGEGQLRFEFGIDRVSQFQDYILTDDGLAGPGNLGTGRRRFVSAELDAPLAKLGLKGVRIKLNGRLQHTAIFDPISQTTRRWSDYFPAWEWSAEIRRDAGAWSYGMAVSDRDRFTFFRPDETDTNYNGTAYGTAFVEWRPGPRTTLTLDVDNLFDTTSRRDRIFYEPTRLDPVPDFRELRIRNRHRAVGLTIKQTFGGGGATK